MVPYKNLSFFKTSGKRLPFQPYVPIVGIVPKCFFIRDAEKSVFSNYPNLGYYPNPSENYPNP